MKNIILMTLLLVSVAGCVPSFDVTERSWLKSIKTPDGRINLFMYSSAYADSPDFIVFESAEVADTLCRSDNVLGMFLANNTLRVHFNGSPRLYMEPVFIVSKLHGYHVVLDTTSVPVSSKGRHYFSDMGAVTEEASN